MSIYHKHHIIPKHMGGSDDPSNLIELTVEEHAEAHRKLFEEYGRWQDELAWKGLSQQISCADAVKEAIIRANKGIRKSKEHILKNSESHKGVIFSEDRKRKISEAKKGKKVSPEVLKLRIGRKRSSETKQKISDSKSGNNHHFFGCKLSEEHKRKISESKKKRKALLLQKNDI